MSLPTATLSKNNRWVYSIDEGSGGYWTKCALMTWWNQARLIETEALGKLMDWSKIFFLRLLIMKAGLRQEERGTIDSLVEKHLGLVQSPHFMFSEALANLDGSGIKSSFTSSTTQLHNGSSIHNLLVQIFLRASIYLPDYSSFLWFRYRLPFPRSF